MFIRRAAIAAAAIAAPLAFAAPAMAAPMDFSCAPCVGDINNDGTEQPIWNEIFASSGNGKGPWETAFSDENGQGAWERAFGDTDGNGAWEKAFPAE